MPQSLCRWCISLGLLVGLGAGIATAERPRAGVLVLAHGGEPLWNATVQQTVAGAGLSVPVEIAFGMGFHAHEVQELQEAVARLEARGTEAVIVVPLLVSSHSEVYRQLEYLLGARERSPIPRSPKPIDVQAAVRFLPPLEGEACVADILLERSRALSREPARETVILVAHGPNTEPDNAAWLTALERWAQAVRLRGGFRAVEVATLRDDAAVWVRRRATRTLRRLVQRAAQEGTAVVVPVLVAPGGVEQKIPQALRGLSYAFSGQTLLPHARISAWIAERVSAVRLSQSSQSAQSLVK
ncbi:MAG: hypothetical protein HY597_00505 [Candidatus Omnitrophica bacterium]|nr:hypothetical protein [Candidatus Omnitrophota bacterium]